MRFPLLSKQNHPLAALCSALCATATGHIGLCLLQWRACCTQHRASFAEIGRKALIKDRYAETDISTVPSSSIVFVLSMSASMF